MGLRNANHLISQREYKNSNERESDKMNSEDIRVKIVPEGSFGGTIEKPILIKEGKPIPEDTGDQGGGQN